MELSHISACQILDKIPEIDDKLAMHPGDDEPLDADCDSFQVCSCARPSPERAVVYSHEFVISVIRLDILSHTPRPVLMST